MTLNLDHLLAQGQATEHEIVEQLVGQFYTPLRRLAQSLLQDETAAADVAQTAIIKAANRIGQYEPHTNLRAWVYKIAVNECRMIGRKQQRRQRLYDLLSRNVREADPRPSPEQSTLQNERDRQLWAAVRRLKEKHRIPIILRYSHNLSIQEIANALNLPQGTVRSRLHYAQKQLHGWLAAEGVTV